MDKNLKQKIKNEIKEIIDEIEYEEYKFNQVFHSNVEFQKSYFKFAKVYEKYGKEAYLKYVPNKFKTQELKDLIKEEKFLEIYEHYGVKTIQNLNYSSNIAKMELNSKSRLKLLFIKLRKFLSGKFVPLPTPTILALPESLTDIINSKNDINVENKEA